MSLITSTLYAGLGAGFLASMITRLIEIFGGKRGGILGTVPTTIVPASLGLWFTNSEAFMEAMWAVPPGMCLNAIFLWLWRVLPPRLPKLWPLTIQLMMMSLMSLGFWVMGAFCWVTMLRTIIHPYVGGIGALVLIVVLGLWATSGDRASPKGRLPVSWLTLISRGIFAGLAVGSSVWLAQTSSGVLSGIAAVFPAIFWTSMVSVWFAQGSAVSSGAVGPMMLGSSSVALYALSSLYYFEHFGPILGAITSWFTAVFFASWPSDLWLHKEERGLIRIANRRDDHEPS